METRERNVAAIASEAAAATYGAEILQRDIEDSPENYTRFFLVRRAAKAETDAEANKMSIAFTLENRPGSLVAALTALSAVGTNLTKIESRPVHGKPWSISSTSTARSARAQKARARSRRSTRIAGC